MKVAIEKQYRPFDLTVDQLKNCTLYECDQTYINGPIYISEVNTSDGKLVRVATLFGSHNGLSYDTKFDSGLANAKYRKFQGSVTLTEE